MEDSVSFREVKTKAFRSYGRRDGWRRMRDRDTRIQNDQKWSSKVNCTRHIHYMYNTKRCLDSSRRYSVFHDPSHCSILEVRFLSSRKV